MVVSGAIEPYTYCTAWMEIRGGYPLGASMDWLQFIAALIQALAWPAMIYAVFHLFRREIRVIMPRMRFRYGEIELTLEEAEEKAAGLTAVAERVVAPELGIPAEKEQMLKLIAISPHAAILAMRARLRSALLKRAQPHAKTGLVGLSVVRSIATLVNEKLIDGATAEIISDLIRIGNTAAHADIMSETISAEQAIRFLELMEKVMPALEATADH